MVSSLKLPAFVRDAPMDTSDGITLIHLPLPVSKSDIGESEVKLLFLRIHYRQRNQ